MELDVRTIQKEDVPAWTEAMRVGFLGHAGEGEADLMAEFVDLDRALGAFDGDRVVGTLRSFRTELTVPGGQVELLGADERDRHRHASPPRTAHPDDHP